jgi:hypothetical protein
MLSQKIRNLCFGLLICGACGEDFEGTTGGVCTVNFGKGSFGSFIRSLFF